MDAGVIRKEVDGVTREQLEERSGDRRPLLVLRAAEVDREHVRFRQRRGRALIEDVEGTLWPRALIEACRAAATWQASWPWLDG